LDGVHGDWGGVVMEVEGAVVVFLVVVFLGLVMV